MGKRTRAKWLVAVAVLQASPRRDEDTLPPPRLLFCPFTRSAVDVAAKTLGARLQLRSESREMLGDWLFLADVGAVLLLQTPNYRVTVVVQVQENLHGVQELTTETSQITIASLVDRSVAKKNGQPTKRKTLLSSRESS